MQPRTMSATNRETGQKVTFSWNKPGNPTDQELDMIFAQNRPQNQRKVNSPFSMPGVQPALDKAAAYPGPVNPPVQGQGNAGIDVAGMAQQLADQKLGKVSSPIQAPVQAPPAQIPPLLDRNAPLAEPFTIDSLKRKIAESLGLSPSAESTRPLQP